MDGRISVCDLFSPLVHQEQNLTNLTDCYVKALQDNINNQFEESLPVLTAFHMFDVTAIFWHGLKGVWSQRHRNSG